jgi:hypothetical protein
MAQRELIHPAVRPRSPGGKFLTYKHGVVAGSSANLSPNFSCPKPLGSQLKSAATFVLARIPTQKLYASATAPPKKSLLPPVAGEQSQSLLIVHATVIDVPGLSTLINCLSRSQTPCKTSHLNPTLPAINDGILYSSTSLMYIFMPTNKAPFSYIAIIR